jgi:hypothetical protein
MRIKSFVLFLVLLLTLSAGAHAQSTSNLALTDCNPAIQASSTINSSYHPLLAFNGDRTGRHWGTGQVDGGGWNSGQRDIFPQWLSVTFSRSYKVSSVTVVGLQNDFNNPVEPTPEMTGVYANVDFDIQIFDGLNWVSVAQVRGNDRVLRTVTFSQVVTRAVRVLVLTAPMYARVIELEVYGSN